MRKKMWALLGATAMTAGVALNISTARAETAAKTEVKKADLTEVKVCPMTGEAIHGAGVGSEIVGQYNVHFCCGGCKGEFDKLPKKEQERRVEQAAKTQKENAKQAQDGAKEDK